MKALFSILFAIGLGTAYCNKQPAAQTPFAADTCLHATVIDTSNLDCGMPLLSFAKDAPRIRAITQRKEVLYIAKDLPPALNVKGKQLCVTVTLLQGEEDFNCTMMGITYPHIKVVSAKAVE